MDLSVHITQYLLFLSLHHFSTAESQAPETSAWAIKAEPWFNSTVLVTWQPPSNVENRAIGYTVHYEGRGKKDSPAGRVNVANRDENNRWSTVLKGLKNRRGYKIYVEAITRPRDIADNKRSPEVSIFLERFDAELSIRATPLGPETVLVTLDTVGGDKVDKLRILYSDDSAIKWNRVDGYNDKEHFAVVTGLQPRTRYFFAAKATVNKKARSVVTHVQTPPAGISRPTNLSVEAKSENSVLVSWGYQGRVIPNGFIVLVERSLPDGSFSPDKHHVVFNENEVLVPDLQSDEQYQVKVEPFDAEGVGTCSDPVLFQLASVTTQPPQSTDKKPEDSDYRMTANITKETPDSVAIRWTVDRGPLENISAFTVTIKGNEGLTLLQKTLPSKQRHLTIRSLRPDNNYFVNVKANGRGGTLAESDVSFKTDPANTVTDTSNPVLEIEANEVRAQDARIDWTVINADPNLVKRYRLRVFDGGPGGNNLLTQELQANQQSFSLRKLQPNSRYHVIIDALTADNSDLLSASLTFETSSPNEYGLPVAASPDSSTAPLQPRTTPEQTPAPDKAHSSTDSATPSLQLEIKPEGANSTRLTWSSHNMSPGTILGYLLNVRYHSEQGPVMVAERLGAAVDTFKLDGLKNGSSYYIELIPITDVGSPFLLVGVYYFPGVSVTPLKATPRHTNSWAFPGVQAETKDGNSSENNLVITRATREGSTVIVVEWKDVTTSDGVPTRDTLIRYGMLYTSNQKDDYRIDTVPAGQRRFIITNLAQRQSFHIQIASKPMEGQSVRWTEFIKLMGFIRL